MTNRLVGIGLILLVFLGSIGIPLYRHSCTHEQIIIQTLFTSSDHCEEEIVEPCCKEKASDELLSDDCCSDEIKRLSLSFDYFESDHYQHPVWIAEYPLLTAFRFTPEILHTDESVIICQITRPPPKPLGERLPVNCCWRL
ncbi:MAG: hypothetical protein A3D31_10415 [Candidatus Fluviicola riflensis]|nr:MAG: hypothetical protein CHH17_14835 [Candidatus Fluviicola riflensis]OGS77414.1 MAG: hypothetical protein A3D31_10415 [Candidatus Fluviicola riflensis]OGS83994.1 MAG: hypothetical protein A3E30_11815 [Fluviicola sp. RIFCSPHIGHO2_12_FULL_43_24]OGS84481.1 MAG: hypothetical protein A2724_07355 [Fluviicola sp. RIFCSPHIGHO2_01_FULL_43_53]